MSFAKKLDRAVQWAGEKMGSEAKTAHSDEFQRLEAEMALRQEGMESLQKATTAYSKWISRRCDASEDKSRAPPTAVLGRAMVAHGNDFEPHSEFGNHLVVVGRANERIANLHSNYTEDVNANWLHHLDRNVAMMKEFQVARKKLESRRLAYDTSVAKMHKAKRDDFRIEEEMRVSRTKFDDASEDVMRRMQDVQDTEAESIGALNSFLEAQLNYHERAAEELRRIRQSLVDGGRADSPQLDEIRISRTRSSTSTSWHKTRQVSSEQLSPAERLPIRRLASSQAAQPPPPLPAPSQDPRQSLVRAATFGERTPLASAGTRMPSLARTATDRSSHTSPSEDVFRDDESTGSGDGSAGWGNRSTSSATSYDSSSRMTSGHEVKKAPPPPPPVNRAKKPPPPPVPARRAHLGH